MTGRKITQNKPTKQMTDNHCLQCLVFVCELDLQLLYALMLRVRPLRYYLIFYLLNQHFFIIFYLQL